MIGDAEGLLASNGTKIGKFEDNDAYILGMKLSYAALSSLAMEHNT